MKWRKLILILFRIIFGFTFLFSGFAKAVDPQGSAFKFIDYFRAFDLTALNNLALLLAILLAALEFAIGACILFGVFKRWTIRAGILFMCFFTPLTFYLALANPVKDCGCFGDAFIITNWETFGKNIILLGIIIYIYIYRKQVHSLFSSKLRWVPLIYGLIFPMGISIYGLNNLPIIDFRPFKTGVHIPSAMKTTYEGEPQYVLIYERDGKTKEFSLDNYPTDDSWTFVETKTILPDNSKEATIKDFFLIDDTSNDVTQDILNYPDYSFLLIFHDLETANTDYVDQINKIYELAQAHQIPFYGVSVPDKQAQQNWKDETYGAYSFLSSDVTVLETVIRANPGLVLLKNGTIVWKKNMSQLADLSQIENDFPSLGQSETKKSNSLFIFLASFFVFFAPILVLLSFEKMLSYFKNKKKQIDNN